MAATVTLTVNPDDEARLNKFIRDLGTGLSSGSLRQFVYANARPYLQARAAQRFIRGGDDVTNAWKPLTEATQRIRAYDNARYGLGIQAGTPINRRTGALQKLVTSTYHLDEGHREVMFTMPGPADGYLELKLKHAQQGGTVRLPPTKLNKTPVSRKFPARPVVGMNDVDKARLEQRFGAWIQGMLRTIL